MPHVLEVTALVTQPFSSCEIQKKIMILQGSLSSFQILKEITYSKQSNLFCTLSFH